jgi:hypothetical protein
MGASTTTRLDAWLVRIREKDKAAFGELVCYFERRLEELASRMLKGFPRIAAREQTGDILQEALLRLNTALKALVAGDDGPAGAKTFHGADFFRFAALQIRRELLDLANYHDHHPADPLPDAASIRPANATWDPRRLAEWSEFHQRGFGNLNSLEKIGLDLLS